MSWFLWYNKDYCNFAHIYKHYWSDLDIGELYISTGDLSINLINKLVLLIYN